MGLEPTTTGITIQDSNQLSYSHHKTAIHCLARPAGIEPATTGLEGRCSIRLSYGRPVRNATSAATGMVGVEGFEPPTSCSQSRRATRLRYTPPAETYHSSGRPTAAVTCLSRRASATKGCAFSTAGAHLSTLRARPSPLLASVALTGRGGKRGWAHTGAGSCPGNRRNLPVPCGPCRAARSSLVQRNPGSSEPVQEPSHHASLGRIHWQP